MTQFVDPYLGRRLLGREEAEALAQVVRAQALFRYTRPNTSQSRQLEHEISTLLGAPEVVAVSSGTMGLQAALMALAPEVGDFVLVPALTFIATAAACLAAAVVPICVDTDAQGHMSPDALQQALARLARPPRAVIFVHLDGAGGRIEEVAEICASQRVALLEDVAQALGGSRAGMPLGTFGQVGCFSLQENKVIGSGEGGFVVCSGADLADRLRAYIDQGCLRDADGMPSWRADLGYGINGRIGELQAAVARVQLRRLPHIQSALRSGYARIVGRAPAGLVVDRNEEDLKVSAWCQRAAWAETSLPGCAPAYDWSRYLLPTHPIIMGRRSPYGDRFPWPKEGRLPQFPTPMAARVARERVCLPVPVVEQDLCAIERILENVR